MNENEFFNNSTNPYRATRNLNTEIENPQININSAVGVNIQDIPETNIQNNDTIDKYFDVNLNHPNQQPTPNNDFQNSNSYNNTNFNNRDFNNLEQNNFNNNNTFINQDIKEQYESSQKTFINPNLANNNIDYNNDYEESNYSSNNEEYVPTNNTTHYQPTMQEKHKKESLKMPSELKVTIFIVLLLLLFISVMPYIFDFFKTIELTLFG